MRTLDDRLPFTVLLPEGKNHPIEIQDHSVGLRMALVDRSEVNKLGEDWNESAGAYALFGPLNSDGTYSVYAGKSPSGLKTRLIEHRRQKEDWNRALLIQRAIYEGLTSTHAAWLEGDLYDLFKGAEKATLTNLNVPRDRTVLSHEISTLESFRGPIVRVLRMLGYDPDSAEDLVVPVDQPSGNTKTTRKSTYYGVTIQDLIDAGYLVDGQRLVSIWPKYSAEAFWNADGTVLFNNNLYPSVSKAASKATGLSAANGWDFWGIEDANGNTHRLAAIRTEYKDSRLNKST